MEPAYKRKRSIDCLEEPALQEARRGSLDSVDDSVSPAGRLRSLLREQGCLTLLGCYDCVSAKAILGAGFKASFLSGYAVSASRLGMPDVGLATYSEMVETATNICRCVGEQLCIIGDGDTGYGGAVNVRRTIEGYARAGLAGITIEDQVFPKRCAYANGIQVTSREEAVARLRAAIFARDELRARSGLDLVIVGRTDVRNAEKQFPGKALEEALARCEAFESLGADVIIAEGLSGKEEMEQLRKRLRPETPTMMAQVEGAREGQTMMSVEEAGRLGFKLCLFGVTMLSAHFRNARDIALNVAEGVHPEVGKELLPFRDLSKSVGFEEVYEWEKRAVGDANAQG
mmetsp:Transcript_77891/g.225282  ORF Transcript_77891/g.225282 Transcript_77891/m.225282 type:complete len:344 (+) Transcript_77891:97-1128(+)